MTTAYSNGMMWLGLLGFFIATFFGMFSDDIFVVGLVVFGIAWLIDNELTKREDEREARNGSEGQHRTD